jgi:hypothetical protein
MILKRYCGHLEEVEEPESGERFLMERGRYCLKCRRAFRNGGRKFRRNEDHELPRAMASAMADYGE